MLPDHPRESFWAFTWGDYHTHRFIQCVIIFPPLATPGKDVTDDDADDEDDDADDDDDDEDDDDNDDDDDDDDGEVDDDDDDDVDTT